MFRVSENMNGVMIRVDACTHVYIQKANESCFSFLCFAVLHHSCYLNAREHLTIGGTFLETSEHSWEAPFSFKEILAFLVSGSSHEEELCSSSAFRSALYHPVRKLLLQQMSANMKGHIGLTCHEQRVTVLSQGVRAQFINAAFFTSQLPWKK